MVGDYLLLYKRATAYFSLSRHASALDDFSKVLELTSGEFDRALMVMANMYTKDGDFAQAKSTLDAYTSKVPGKPTVDELMADIKEAQAAGKKASNSGQPVSRQPRKLSESPATAWSSLAGGDVTH